MFRPSFTITNKILSLVGLIEASREAVSILQLASDWEVKFRKDALVRMVYFNSHIDGNGLTYPSSEKIVFEEPDRDESAEEVAKRLLIVGKEKDIQMVMNYRNGLKYIDQLARLGKKTGITFSEKECLQVHSLLMEKILPSHQLGVYRIASPILSDKLSLSVPLPVETPYQMEDFWVWVKNANEDEIHSVLKAGVAHFELMRIQPFSDGNGGVARLVSDLILAINGYNDNQFFCVEEFLDKNTDDYFSTLSDVSDQGDDLTAWLTFYCSALAAEMERVKDRVRHLSAENSLVGGIARQIALSERQVALLDAFRLKDELTMSDARRILPMVSDDTILRDLAALLTKKLIRKKGKTKGVRYILRK